MNILIAEDEAAARKNLIAIVKEVEPDSCILATCASVAELRTWIENNPPPDIAFFDIQLSDANIFNLFKYTKVRFPVVFVTAYNQYAIDAFKVNSIDYILKPVISGDIEFALKKFREIREYNIENRQEFIYRIIDALNDNRQKKYIRSVLVQVKDKLIPIEASNFSYFYTEDGLVYLVTSDNKRYITGKRLDMLESQLDPDLFYRANRQYIISRASVREISPYFHERLSVRIVPVIKQNIVISKRKASDFKNWLGR